MALVNGPDVPRLQAEKTLIQKTATSYWNYVMQFNHSPNRPTGDIRAADAPWTTRAAMKL